MKRDFAAELRAICRKDFPTEPEVVVPPGDRYAVFRRSTRGHSRKVLVGLPQGEAEFWCRVFNAREVEKRLAAPSIDEAFFYDTVKLESVEESPYWNPRPVVLEVAA